MKINSDDIRAPLNDDPKKKIKNDIIDQFRKINANVGVTLPSRWLGLVYYPSLNPKEQAVFDEAITELADSGLVEVLPDTLRLTKKGVESIY